MLGGMSFGLWLPWIISCIAFVGCWYVGIIVWGRKIKEEEIK